MNDRVAPHSGLPPGWLTEQVWKVDGRIVRALRNDDIEFLRRWRNEQQAVLRQQSPLSPEHQRHWFEHVVLPSYQQQHPHELLVVVTENEQPVAYGGLTNIEWVSRRAELSFLAATARTHHVGDYRQEFTIFLRWVIQLTFDELGFARLFTETWSFRQDHIDVLEAVGFKCEGTLRNHVVKDGVYYDALIHGLLATEGSNND